MSEILSDHKMGFIGSTYIICRTPPMDNELGPYPIEGKMPRVVGRRSPVNVGETVSGRFGNRTILFRIGTLKWSETEAGVFSGTAWPLQVWKISTGDIIWRRRPGDAPWEEKPDLLEVIEEIAEEDADLKFWKIVSFFIVAALVSIWFLA